MVDIKELNIEIDKSGMTIPKIAERAGIPQRNLYNKLDGKSPFKADDIVGLTAALRLTNARRDQIFLVKK